MEKENPVRPDKYYHVARSNGDSFWVHYTWYNYIRYFWSIVFSHKDHPDGNEWMNY